MMDWGQRVGTRRTPRIPRLPFLSSAGGSCLFARVDVAWMARAGRALSASALAAWAGLLARAWRSMTEWIEREG